MKISKNVNDLVNNIKNGKVVCFKTDTVYGFSVDPNNYDAINKLYEIKNRRSDKAFIYLIKENQDLNELVDNINENEKKLIKKFWPGPLTIIFKPKENLDMLKYYPDKTEIALRMPDDKLCQEILSKLDYPLPSTSVNRAGEKSLNDFDTITKSLYDEDFCILKNQYDNNSSPSTMVIAIDENVRVIREGAIKKEEIFACLNVKDK